MKCLALHMIPRPKRRKTYEVIPKRQAWAMDSFQEQENKRQCRMKREARRAAKAEREVMKAERQRRHLAEVEAKRIEKENKKLLWEIQEQLRRDNKREKKEKNRAIYEQLVKEKQIKNNFHAEFQRRLDEQAERENPKTQKRWIRFTDHALARYQERIAKYGYSQEQIINDLRKWWRSIRWDTQGDNAYSVKGSIATYTIAKDRKTFDWVIITIFLTPLQEKRLQEHI